MALEEKLIVSKNWHKPNHELLIGQTGFAIVTSMPDIAKAFAHEIGNPMFILTQAQLEAKLLASLERIVEKIKQVSVHT